VGASDLHLKAGNLPFVRVAGELSPTAFGPMSAADTETAALELMPEHKWRAFEATSEADFGYTLAGVGRFRVNVFRQRSTVGLAIRRVRSEVPTVAELMPPRDRRARGLEPRAGAGDLADRHRRQRRSRR
jgi:twitching motility protein PilT